MFFERKLIKDFDNFRIFPSRLLVSFGASFGVSLPTSALFFPSFSSSSELQFNIALSFPRDGDGDDAGDHEDLSEVSSVKETLRGVEVVVDLLAKLFWILGVMRADISSSWIPVVSYRGNRRDERWRDINSTGDLRFKKRVHLHWSGWSEWYNYII